MSTGALCPNVTPMPEDHALMQAHVDALYLHDARGRMQVINDGSGTRAPRLWLGRTRRGVQVRVRDDLPAPVVARLTALVEREPADVWSHLPSCWSSVLAVLEDHAPIQSTSAGPTFACPAVLPERGEAAKVTADNRDVLREGLDAWQVDVDEGRPMRAVVVAGRAVSVCASVRITEHAEEAGVETLPEHRRRGHARAVVAAWANDAIARGVMALYSTSWDNEASRAVADALGLHCFGVECHVT